MKFTQTKSLSKNKFKRLTGMSRQTYHVIVKVIKEQEINPKKPGRPCTLSPEDQVLIAIQYWREYRTYFHIGVDWGVSESTVCRTVHKVENLLIKSGKFALPGQKELRKLSDSETVLVIDVMESSIERPSKGQKGFYSGKQKKHTLKTQVIIELETRRIMCLRHGKGKIHDFKLFKKSGVKLPKNIKLLADKGYQGILKIHELSETPIKKPKGGKLTNEQKKSNRELNQIRVAVEQVNRCLKIFKILSYPYRNRRYKFGLRSHLIAGIYNNELAEKA
ncbi:MAG TPA: IS5 family transposase [Candidatus Limnocylindrales bacterium]|nr:IS5 family transposase [Candidatus Limnocylindrales bacterium]